MHTRGRFAAFLLIASLLASCATHRAPRVNCDRHLEPINVPTPPERAQQKLPQQNQPQQGPS